MNTEWKGPQDGLPPVGTECEYYKNDEWRKGVIFGHRKHRNGAVDVFIDFGSEWDYTSDLPRFRPVQSERDKGITEALSHINQAYDANPSVSPKRFVKNAVAQLYDAGYRKPMSRAEANNAISVAFKGVPFSVSQRTSLLDALGYKD